MTQKKENFLDIFDYKILDLVQHDNSLSLQSISEAVNLSSTAVQRRLKRLDKAGVICRHSSMINPESVGKVITIIVEVHVEKTCKDKIVMFREKFSIPEIQQCYHLTGEADFMLILNVASMSEYEEIETKLFYNDKNIKWFKTTIVKNRVKATMGVYLQDIIEKWDEK